MELMIKGIPVANSDREISVTISEREFLRLLREKGVVFA